MRGAKDTKYFKVLNGWRNLWKKISISSFNTFSRFDAIIVNSMALGESESKRRGKNYSQTW